MLILIAMLNLALQAGLMTWQLTMGKSEAYYVIFHSIFVAIALLGFVAAVSKGARG
jgi:hypothetical protein